jgi:hypothetical protein
MSYLILKFFALFIRKFLLGRKYRFIAYDLLENEQNYLIVDSIEINRWDILFNEYGPNGEEMKIPIERIINEV